MAKFQLAEGEKLIGSATMAFVEKAAVAADQPRENCM